MNNEIAELIKTLNAEEPRDLPDFCADRESMIAKEYERVSGYMIGADRDAELLPTWVMATAKGQVVVMATPFDGEWSKDLIGTVVRKFMREANVVRYAFTSEAWMAKPTKESWDAGDRRPPSEREDRVEIVMIIAADREDFTLNTYQIEREASGQITALSPMEQDGKMEGFSGRFTNMLDKAA